MPRLEYWLQLENQTWDVSPNGLDRTTGISLPRDANNFFRPMPEQALIVRRYVANWASPADLPLNVWDLAEPNPAQTRGTIPGATLEAKIGDEVIVHFRNMDMRTGVPDRERIHSLYAQGLNHAPGSDGTYPFSPPDPRQGNKQGDRVAPGDTFDYTYTASHLSNAGAWLYYDASVAAGASIALGAFGALIVRQGGESRPPALTQLLRGAGDTQTQFAHLPTPATSLEHLLVWHTLKGVGDCLNGKQFLGNTPTLISRTNSRVKFRLLNLTDRVQVFHLHGHRWARGNDWMDSASIAPGSGATVDWLEGTTEAGGSNGEWRIANPLAPQFIASYVVTDGGALALSMGDTGGGQT